VNTQRLTSLLLRPGITDIGCALLLVVGSVVAVRLEPAYRDFWTFVPLSVALTLLLAATLLVVNVRVATATAAAIHVLLLILFALGALLSAFLLVTILFFGTGLVLLPPFLALAANSFFTLRRIVAANRAKAASPRGPLTCVAS